MKTPTVYSQHATDLVQKDKALQQLVACCAEFSTDPTQDSNNHPRNVPDGTRTALTNETRVHRPGPV